MSLQVLKLLLVIALEKSAVLCLTFMDGRWIYNPRVECVIHLPSEVLSRRVTHFDYDNDEGIQQAPELNQNFILKRVESADITSIMLGFKEYPDSDLSSEMLGKNITFERTLSKKFLASLQMKKIGLEIPESTRKDMEHNSNEITNTSHNKTRRRILQCVEGYNNTATNSCVACTTYNANCDGCTSTVCNSCNNDFTLSLGTCVCFNGYVDSSICVKCSTAYEPKCLTCNSVDCLSCAVGFRLISGVCSPCTNIHAACDECSLTACIRCTNNFTLNSGTCKCGTGLVVFNGNCTSCAWGCSACVTNPSTCTACNSGYFLDNAACMPCGSSCQDCESLTSCRRCAENQEPIGTEFVDRQCVPCAVGMCSYGGACVTAVSPCTRCSGWEGRCTACIPGLSIVPSEYACYKICGPNQYYHNTSYTCVDCSPTSCSKCVRKNTSVVYCTECESTHVLLPTYSCQLYAAPDDTKYRLPSGELGSVAPLAPKVRYTRNMGIFEGDTNGRYTINPTTLAYMPCAAPMSTCVRVSTSARPLTCVPNNAYFNDSCVAKFASGFVNSTSMQVVASPDPKVLFYDSDGAKDCALGFSWSTANSACLPMTCKANFDAVANTCAVSATLEGCASASSSTTCSLCSEYYYSIGPVCSKTYSNCLSSTNSTSSCIQCTPGFQRRQDGVCSPVCPDGYTLNSTNFECRVANGSCKSYERDMLCSDCLAGYYLTADHQCIKPCQKGLYWNSINSACEACSDMCLHCAMSSVCLQCQRGSTLSNGICLPPPTCFPGCQNCTSSSSKGCFATLPGYYLNYSNEVVKYTPYCDYGKYYDSTDETCYSCHSTCESCSGRGRKSCLKCSVGLMRYGSICLDIASTTCKIFEGKTFDLTNNITLPCIPCPDPQCRYCPDSICEECMPGKWPSSGTCQSCVGTVSTYCHQVSGMVISCPGGYKMISGQCIKICRPSYYFATSTSTTCTKCPSNCATCSLGATVRCTSCNPGDVLYWPANSYWNCTNNQDVSFNGYYGYPPVRCPYPMMTCLSSTSPLTCYEGYYMNAGVCSECADRCLTCSGAASNCTSCHMGYTYDGALGTCTAVCERYEYLDTASLECIPCSRNCRTCDSLVGSGKKCTTCFDGFYRDSTTFICLPCHHACLQCTGPGNASCSSCLPEFSLSSGSCIRTVNPSSGVYYDQTLGKPNLCHKFCSQCVGPSGYNCTGCISGFSLTTNTFVTDQPATTTGTCKRVCPTGMYFEYEYPNECLACHFSCDSCDGQGPDSCLICPQNRLRFGSRCEACHPSCLQCSGLGPKGCSQCQVGFSLDPTSKFCIKSCTAPTKFNPITQQCTNCHSSCAMCLDNTATGCITCDPATPNLLTSGECLLKCPFQNQIYLPEKRICYGCHTDCKSCFGLGDTQCYECQQAGYFIQAGTDNLCKLGCEVHNFQVNSTHCLRCHDSCESCNATADSGCLSCFDGFFLQPDFTCKTDCPQGYIENPTTRVCVRCAPNCKFCSKNSDPYACTECFDPRYLRDDNLCAKNCSAGLYFYDVADDCYTCHQNCQTCTGGSAFDCEICSDGLYKSYNGECVSQCPSDSVLKVPACLKCHLSCLTCEGTGILDCLTCQTPLLLTASGQCNTQCDPREIAVDGQNCLKCHESCDSCSSTDRNACISCVEPTITIMSDKSTCVDCLRSPQTDQSTCWFSVPLSLAEPSTRSLSVKASVSVKLTFPGQSAFLPRLPELKLLEVLDVKVSRLDAQEWTWKLRIAGGDILIDLYFIDSKSWTTTVEVMPKVQIVLTNSRNGVAELIFWNQSAKHEIPVKKAADPAILSVLESAVAVQGTLSTVSGASTAVMTVFMMFSTSPMGGMLLRLLQVFKQLSRLRLLNVFFGSYLEMCLQFVATIYPVGGDNISNTEAKAITGSRGKLDMYRVGVFSAQIMAWNYAVYFLLTGIRIYRTKVRAYANHLKLLSGIDRLIDSVGEKCRTMIIAVVGIDIVFYSLRCLAHMNLNDESEFISVASFALSLATVTFITADLISLLIENQQTVFPQLRNLERIKRNINNGVYNSELEATQHIDSPRKVESSGSIAPLGAIKIEVSIVGGPKKPREPTPRVHTPEEKKRMYKKNKELYYYLYGYRQQKRVIDNPSAEQFFGNGIKLHKLRTPEGRYYNTVAMIKLFVFEPIFINLQLFSMFQMLAITVLQIVYSVWISRVAFKTHVFDSKVYSASIVCNELAVLVFMLAGCVVVISGGIGNLKDSVSNGLQLTAVIFILLASLVGMVEFIVGITTSAITLYKDRRVDKLLEVRELKKEEQGLVRHRVIGRDLPGAEPPVPPVDADMSSSVADIKANQVGQSAKPVLGKTRLAPGKRLSRPPLQPLARK